MSTAPCDQNANRQKNSNEDLHISFCRASYHNYNSKIKEQAISESETILILRVCDIAYCDLRKNTAVNEICFVLDTSIVKEERKNASAEIYN